MCWFPLKSLIKFRGKDTHVHVGEEKSLLKCISIAYLELVSLKLLSPAVTGRDLKGCPFRRKQRKAQAWPPNISLASWEHCLLEEEMKDLLLDQTEVTAVAVVWETICTLRQYLPPHVSPLFLRNWPFLSCKKGLVIVLLQQAECMWLLYLIST